VIRIFYVDAFTKELFKGNPAAVCVLEEWPGDDVLQAIAFENNLSETAFVNLRENPLQIRWFTPTLEVELCGHATLATARILFDEYFQNDTKISFQSKSGELIALKKDDMINLDFPIDHPTVIESEPLIRESLRCEPVETLKGRSDYLVILASEKDIKNLQPDYSIIAELNSRGLVVSAKSSEVDFISRCFYPQTGVNEDPVTGSAHCMLAAYWGEKLNKNKLNAYQASARGGYLQCEISNERIILGGLSKRYLEGIINLN
jgi:PhzF family phenazine biosynthesis protein